MVYKNADAEEGEQDRVIRGFKFVPVFDVAQTDGEELPSICRRLDGNDQKGLYAHLVAVAESMGFTVQDHDSVARQTATALTVRPASASRSRTHLHSG